MFRRCAFSTLTAVIVTLTTAVGTNAQDLASPPVPTGHPARNGAWLGVGAMAALLAAEIRGCGTGCEMGAGVGPMLILGVGMGAAGGAALGHLSGRYADRAGTAGPQGKAPRFPSHPHARLGLQYGVTRVHAASLRGSVDAPRPSASWMVTPYMSTHIELTTSGGRYTAAPGSVPSDVLSNLIPAPGRLASVAVGIESRRTRYVLNELLSFHPQPWGRVRIEVLAGLGVVAEETREFYPELSTTGGPRQGTGKYYVLDFETPETGLVLGLDAEIALGGGLSAVPSVRYTQAGRPGSLATVGVGVHWRLP